MTPDQLLLGSSLVYTSILFLNGEVMYTVSSCRLDVFAVCAKALVSVCAWAEGAHLVSVLAIAEVFKPCPQALKLGLGLRVFRGDEVQNPKPQN